MRTEARWSRVERSLDRLPYLRSSPTRATDRRTGSRAVHIRRVTATQLSRRHHASSSESRAEAEGTERPLRSARADGATFDTTHSRGLSDWPRRLPPNTRASSPSRLARGVGSTVIAYGLRPGAPATLTMTGAAQRVFSGNVDAYGIYVKYIGAEFPVGEYRVTLETDGRRFQVTATR